MSTAVVDPVFEALGLTQVDAGGVRGAASPVTLAGALARPGPEKPSAASAAFPPYCAWPPPAWCGYAQVAAAAAAAASAYGAGGAGLPQGAGASGPLVLPEVLPVAAPPEAKHASSPLKPVRAVGTPVSLMLATPPPKSTMSSGFRADAPAFVPGCTAETPSPPAGPRGGLCLFKELACESLEKPSSESKSFVEARAELLRYWCLAKDKEASEMPKVFAAVDVDRVDAKQRGEAGYANDGAAPLPRDGEAAGSLLLRLVKDPAPPASGRGQKLQAPSGEGKGAGKGQSRSKIRASAQAARSTADAPKAQDPVTPSTATGSPTTSGADSDAGSPTVGGDAAPAGAGGTARRRRRGGRGGGGRGDPAAAGGAGPQAAAKTQRGEAAEGAAGDAAFQ